MENAHDSSEQKGAQNQFMPNAILKKYNLPCVAILPSEFVGMPMIKDTPQIVDNQGNMLVEVNEPELAKHLADCVNGCGQIEDPAKTVPELINTLQRMYLLFQRPWCSGEHLDREAALDRAEDVLAKCDRGYAERKRKGVKRAG